MRALLTWKTIIRLALSAAVAVTGMLIGPQARAFAGEGTAPSAELVVRVLSAPVGLEGSLSGDVADGAFTLRVPAGSEIDVAGGPASSYRVDAAGVLFADEQALGPEMRWVEIGRGGTLVWADEQLYVDAADAAVGDIVATWEVAVVFNGAAGRFTGVVVATDPEATDPAAGGSAPTTVAAEYNEVPGSSKDLKRRLLWGGAIAGGSILLSGMSILSARRQRAED